MKPRLDASQGRLVRALALYLSKDRKNLVSDGDPATTMVIEAVASRPWSSLTFIGNRHHLVVRLPADAAIGGEIDGAAMSLTDAIVAVEAATWTGSRLALDLLVIDVAAPEIDRRAAAEPGCDGNVQSAC